MLGLFRQKFLLHIGQIFCSGPKEFYAPMIMPGIDGGIRIIVVIAQGSLKLGTSFRCIRHIAGFDCSWAGARLFSYCARICQRTNPPL